MALRRTRSIVPHSDQPPIRGATVPGVETLRIGCTGLLVILSAVILLGLISRVLQGASVITFPLILWGAILAVSTYRLVTLLNRRASK